MNAHAWFCGVVLVVASSSVAQDLMWTSPTVPHRQILNYGGPIRISGDFNQDGYPDIIVSASGVCNTWAGLWGYLLVLSGRDGSVLQEITMPTPTGRFVDYASAGDFDGDGVPDIVTAEIDDYGSLFWGRPDAETGVRCGRTGKYLAVFPPILSWAGDWDKVFGNIDLDGDGRPDLLVAEWRAGNPIVGEVVAYANHGARLYTLTGSLTSNPPLTVGRSLANLGDIDNDGCDDFVMGCYEPTGTGAGVIVSGRTGTYIRMVFGEFPGDGLGYTAVALSDLDADGVRDFALGNGGSFLLRSLVQAFSTATGQILHQWTHVNGDFAETVGSADFDGDAVADLIAGTPWELNPNAGSGAVYGYSGRDGALLQRIPSWNYPPSPYMPFGGRANIGVQVAAFQPPDDVGWLVIADPNGVIVPTNVVIGNLPCTHRTGVIRAYRGLPSTAVRIGPACAGNLPSPPRIGMRRQGSGIRVHLAEAPPNVPAVLLLGWSTSQFLGVPLPAALDPFGLPGCLLRTSVDHVHVATTGTAGAAAGYAHVDLPIPVPFGNLGSLTPAAQWLVLGDAGTFPGGVTEAIAWR